MSYYKQIQYLAQVDTNDRIIGRVEKWQAHRKNILHRGFTAILYFQDKIILQHRKHPVFDNTYDLSFSSHQIYIGNQLQDDLTAVYDGLQREWNLKKKDLLKPPKFSTKFYYQAKDSNSAYGENEIDYVYKVKLKAPPQPNKNYAYGMEVINNSGVDHIINYFPNISPWVKKMVCEKIAANLRLD